MKSVLTTVLGLCCLLLGFMPGAAFAGSAVDDDVPPRNPKEAAAAIESALGRGENPGVALKAAENLRPHFDDKAFAPVIKAAGQAFKNDKRLNQCLVMDTFAVLEVPGSYKQFEKLLKVPDKVEGTLLRNTYALAIKTAGKLADEDALKPLEKLVAHPDRRFARTAAQSLGKFTELPEKDRSKLVTRLVKALGKTERKLKDKDADVAKRAADVTWALDETLVALSGIGAPVEGGEAPEVAVRTEDQGARTAKEWEALIAERSKRKR
jgi:hypothetical protein